MNKVIVQRTRIVGRRGPHPKGQQRKLRRFCDDELPAREGMRKPWQDTMKCFKEHLGPLRRYLNSNVGRPWSKVFSEICIRLDRSSTVQDLVLDHVKRYVNTNVILIDGVASNADGDHNHGRPLAELPWRPWYVCPRSGLLRRIKRGKQRQRKQQKPVPPMKQVSVSETLECRLIDGAWYLVTLRPLPPAESKHARRRSRHRRSPMPLDILLNRSLANITAAEAQQQYHAPVYAAAKRRLAYRELKQYPIPQAWWV